MTPQILRQILEDRQLQQQELARLLLVDPRTVRRWAMTDEPLDIPGPAKVLLQLILDRQVTLAAVRRASELLRQEHKIGT